MEFPDQDFASPRFDQQSPTDPKRLIYILSTPRSGSTLLCDLLYRNGVCLAHEYFQPYQYMPIMAERWNCMRADGSVDPRAYASALMRYRTLENGVLGINLHATHIGVFKEFEPYFRDLDSVFIYVKREDEIGQAVSYHIASETGQWSEHFRAKGDADYNFYRILQRLKLIRNGNRIIHNWLKGKNIKSATLSYESLAEGDVGEISQAVGERVSFDVSLERQASPTKNEFTALFSNDLAKHSAWYRRLYRRIFDRSS